MAAALTTQVFPHAGASITYTTSGAGGLATTANTTPCGNGLGLLVKNGSGGSLDVFVRTSSAATVDGLAPAIPSGGTAASRKWTIGIGADGIIPLVASIYADPTTALATFDLSTVTSVSVACVSISA
jgi:hypothetical protein